MQKFFILILLFNKSISAQTANEILILNSSNDHPWATTTKGFALNSSHSLDLASPLIGEKGQVLESEFTHFLQPRLLQPISLITTSFLGANVFQSTGSIINSPILHYSDFADPNEVIYKRKNGISGLEFYDNTLLKNKDLNSPLNIAADNHTISPQYSATTCTGVRITQQIVYRKIG